MGCICTRLLFVKVDRNNSCCKACMCVCVSVCACMYVKLLCQMQKSRKWMLIFVLLHTLLLLWYFLETKANNKTLKCQNFLPALLLLWNTTVNKIRECVFTQHTDNITSYRMCIHTTFADIHPQKHLQACMLYKSPHIFLIYTRGVQSTNSLSACLAWFSEQHIKNWSYSLICKLVCCH